MAETTDVCSKIVSLLEETEIKVIQHITEHLQTVINNTVSNKVDISEKLLQLDKQCPNIPSSLIEDHNTISTKTIENLNNKEKTFKERAAKKLDYLVSKHTYISTTINNIVFGERRLSSHPVPPLPPLHPLVCLLSTQAFFCSNNILQRVQMPCSSCINLNNTGRFIEL